MAESKNNIITHGMSGMLGGQIVFRQQRDGRIIVATNPKETTVPASGKQIQVRERFQEAVIYGKAAIANPAIKEAYNQAADHGKSAYNVAVADFFNAPEIDEIDVSNYHGAVGDTLKVRVTDDFKVQSVEVKIENQDSTMVEEGNAVLDLNGLDWIYTTTVANSALTGDKITITAKDTPDNESFKITVLS